MDERIREGYHKIYSELFSITICLAALSLVLKIVFFRQGASQVVLEYIILVGSPIYQLVRSRMLKLAAPENTYSTRTFTIRLAAALAATTVIFLASAYIRDGAVNISAYALFLIPYLLIFLVTAVAMRKLHRRWRKKLEDRYKD